MKNIILILILSNTVYAQPNKCDLLAINWTHSFIQAHNRLMIYGTDKPVVDFSYINDGREWIDYMDKRNEIIEKYKISLDLLSEGIKLGCDFYSSPSILQTGIEYQSMQYLKKHTNDIIDNQERIINFMNKNKNK